MSIPFDDLIEEEFNAIRLIDESKRKAEQTLSEAREKAQRLIDQATKTEHIQPLIKREERTVKKEAETILESYRKRASSLADLPARSLKKAVELAIKEVLKFE